MQRPVQGGRDGGRRHRQLSSLLHRPLACKQAAAQQQISTASRAASAPHRAYGTYPWGLACSSKHCKIVLSFHQIEESRELAGKSCNLLCGSDGGCCPSSHCVIRVYCHPAVRSC